MKWLCSYTKTNCQEQFDILYTSISFSLFPVRYVKQLRTIVNLYAIIMISLDFSHILKYTLYRMQTCIIQELNQNNAQNIQYYKINLVKYTSCGHRLIIDYKLYAIKIIVKGLFRHLKHNILQKVQFEIYFKEHLCRLQQK